MQRRIPTLAVLITAALAGIIPLGAAPAWAAPTLTVSKTTGLTDGASVTVGGSGFTPNLKQIAVGQCIEEVKAPPTATSPAAASSSTPTPPASCRR